jgi:hypothetical protein
MPFDDTWNFGAEEDPAYRRNAVERKLLGPLGITATEGVIDGKNQPQNITGNITEGARLFRKNRFLRGSNLTSIGRSNSIEDAGGHHDLTLHGCIEHPRLQVQTKIYANRVERTYLVDGEPFAEASKAAAVLEKREAIGGIYPRPAFEVGDAEGDAAVG